MKNTEDYIKQTVASNVRQLRELKGWSQSFLAEEADLSTAAIGMIESKKSSGRPATLLAVANALGVEYYQLFVPLDSEKIEAANTPTSLKMSEIIAEQEKELSDYKELIKLLEIIKKSSPTILADLLTLSQEPDENYRNSLFRVLEEAAKASRMSKDKSYKLEGITRINNSFVAERFFQGLEENKEETKKKS